MMMMPKGVDFSSAVTGSKNKDLTGMTLLCIPKHGQYQHSQLYELYQTDDKLDWLSNLKQSRQMIVFKTEDILLSYPKSSEKLFKPIADRFFGVRSLSQVLHISELTILDIIRKASTEDLFEFQHLASSVPLIVCIIDDFEDPIDNSKKRKLYHLIQRVGFAGALLLLFAPELDSHLPQLSERMARMVVYTVHRDLFYPLQQIMAKSKALKVHYLQMDGIKRLKQERQLYEATLKPLSRTDLADRNAFSFNVNASYDAYGEQQLNNALSEKKNSFVFLGTEGINDLQLLDQQVKFEKNRTKRTLPKNGDLAWSMLDVHKQQVAGRGDKGTKPSQVFSEKDIPLIKNTAFQRTSSSIGYINFSSLNDDNDYQIATLQTPGEEARGVPNGSINQASARGTSNIDGGRIPETVDLGKPDDHIGPDGNKGHSSVSASTTPETGVAQITDTGLSRATEDNSAVKGSGEKDDKERTPETDSEENAEEHGALCSKKLPGADVQGMVTGTHCDDTGEKAHEKGATAQGYPGQADETVNGITSGLDTGVTGQRGAEAADPSCSQVSESCQSHFEAAKDTSSAEDDKDSGKDDDSRDEHGAASMNFSPDSGTPDNRQSSEMQDEQSNTTPNLLREAEGFVLSVKENIHTASHAAQVEQNVPECRRLDPSPVDQGALDGKESFPMGQGQGQGSTVCTAAWDEQKLAPRAPPAPPLLLRQQDPGLQPASDPTSSGPAGQERLEMDKGQDMHWTLERFRPRDSAVERPRHSDQADSARPTIPRDLRQRMQQRNFRIASMVHLGASLPLDVVGLAEAGIYYDEDKDEMCCCHCSWRMSLRDFCRIQTPANTHVCTRDTGDDSVTVQGRESECEQQLPQTLQDGDHKAESSCSEKSPEPIHNSGLHGRDLEVDDDESVDERTVSGSESEASFQGASGVDTNAFERLDFEDSASSGNPDRNQRLTLTSEDTGEYSILYRSSDTESDADTVC